MELFKLLGTIAVQNQGAVDAIEETTGHAAKAESKMSKNFEKIGAAAAKCGKVIATGMAAGAVAIGGLAKSAVESYADYEQLAGGVETLFKDSADTVMGYADKAFKTAGLSANKYMETVTSFSASLLQSLDGDTQKSADYANQAIIDMADNANKMGTSIESIKNAYQGFAKQNYSMLDNLKLGYGGTSMEMYRLLQDAKEIDSTFDAVFSIDEKGHLEAGFADITKAIHIIQTEMGITGTTAVEASSTISGSLSSMKSSWQNFLTGIADGNQDIGALTDNLINSAMTFADNLLPRIQGTVPRLVNGLVEVVNRVVPMIPSLMQSFLPGIIDGAVLLIEGLVNTLPKIVGVIMEALPSLIKGVERIFISLVAALPSIVETLVNALPGLIPMIISAIASMLLVLMHYLPQIVQPIADALPDIIVLIIDTLMDNLPALINGLVQLVVAIVRATPQIIVGIIQAIPQIISSILVGIWNALPVLIMGIVQIVKEIGLAIWELIGPFATAVAEWFAEFFSGIWEKIKEFVAPIAEFFKNLWTKIVDTFHMVIDPWIEIAKRAFVKVKEFFEPIIENIKEKFVAAVEKIKEVFAPVADFFKGVWSGIKNAFGSVADWFKDVFSKAWENVKNVFSKGGQVFSGIKEGIEKTFKTVVNKLISGINTIIKKPFAKLNELITKLKGINILGVSPFSWMKNFDIPQIPQLEEGGVLKKGQIGLLEGNGAEAVVPLEKNTGWLDKIAERLNASTSGDGYSRDVVNKLNELIELMKALKIYLYGDVLVGELAPAMDSALGSIYTSKGRGN